MVKSKKSVLQKIRNQLYSTGALGGGGLEENRAVS